MRAAAHTSQWGIRPSCDLPQFPGCRGAAQLIEGSIIREGDETVLANHLQGSVDALPFGIAGWTYLVDTTLRTVPIAFPVQLFYQEIGSLEVDTPHLHLAIAHLVVLTLHLVGLAIVEA